MIKLFFLAGAGSALGGILRQGINIIIQNKHPGSIPWNTLAVNLAGSLLIGILAGLSKENTWLPEESRVFLMTGICGGFTTFSAFSIENLKLFQSGNNIQAIIYISLSIAGGILLAFGGMNLIRIFR